jgi:hypothetical protein
MLGTGIVMAGMYAGVHAFPQYFEKKDVIFAEAGYAPQCDVESPEFDPDNKLPLVHNATCVSRTLVVVNTQGASDFRRHPTSIALRHRAN